jgi:hypothetical protein
MFPLLAPYKKIPIVVKLAIITGKGAVGLPVNTKIKSGSARNPITIKKRKDNFLNAERSLIDKDPIIINIIPIITELVTRLKVSNI